MEEKEMIQRFYGSFEYLTQMLEDVKKGFFTQKLDLLKENKQKLKVEIKQRASFAEKVVVEKEKDQIQKRYIGLLVSFQNIVLAIDALINKMQKKVEVNVLFTKKALSEIEEIFDTMHTQFVDTRDYIATKNQNLKKVIKSSSEKLIELSEKYDMVHQQRLIGGTCMPKASYFYIDITQSLKRISKALTDFSEKL
jgi:Na+/phosphate symporter